MEKLTEQALSDQPLKEDERKLLQEVYERLELFEEACRPFHEAAKDARDIVRLRDPYQDKANVKEKTLQLQTLKSTFNNCVADQMMSMPEAKLLPETEQMSDVVEDLQDLVHHVVYEVNNYENIHRRRAEDLYGPGTVVTQIAWDPDMNFGKGDCAIIRWPVEAFLWDPQADNIQDARAVIKVSWHPLSWYREHYPDVAAYVNDEDGQYNNVGLPDEHKKQSNDEGRAMMLEYWYRTYKDKKYKINVAYCAGGALLEHHENVYMHGMYPFVIDVHSVIEGSMVGEGMVQELAPMMRYINRYARYIDTNLRMSSKGRMVVRRDSGIDREALADWSQDIVEGDNVIQGQDWNWIQHVPFNGMISNQMLQFQSDLKQDAGANQFTRGETTGGIVSGKAIAALQSAGGKVQQLHTNTMNNGFKQIIKQILWLMAEFYDKDRVALVTGKDSRMRQVKYDSERFFGKKGKEIAPPPYIVQVEVVTRDPVRIETQNQMYMQAYTMAAQAQQYFPLSALFRLMNVEGKDRLLPIIEENEQQQQMMMQLQQQNAEMAAQLEQANKENESLRYTSTRMANSLAARGGFSPEQGSMPAAEAGGGPYTNSAIANMSREQIEAMPEMAG